MTTMLQNDRQLVGDNDWTRPSQSIPDGQGIGLRVATREVVQDPLEKWFDA